MVGVAVKVTLVPEQIVCAPAVIAMLTLGVTFEVTETLTLPVIVFVQPPVAVVASTV